jgi:hypothetical protein
MARNFDIHDRGLTTRIRDAQASVFAEDVEIPEARQENIPRRPDRKLTNLNIDRAAFTRDASWSVSWAGNNHFLMRQEQQTWRAI